jgi:DNA-binding transcriptional MerR regulator
LIEELLTIEQMKKSYYSLYKIRKCIYCNQEDETFNHVWSCNKRIEEMKDLINLHDKILIFEINKHLKEHNKNTINYDILVCLNDIVKGVDTIETKFNFIDIIKGFVPLSLSEIIFVLT